VKVSVSVDALTVWCANLIACDMASPRAHRISIHLSVWVQPQSFSAQRRHGGKVQQMTEAVAFGT
jgi:hypothetical protein